MQSFSDIRAAVSDALAAVDKDHGKDIIVSDLGPDWVVYSDPDTDGPGLVKRGYELTDGKVKFTSDPAKVSRKTVYEGEDTAPPKTLKEARVQVREHFRRARTAARDQPVTAAENKE